MSIFSINIDLFDPIVALVTAILVGFVYGQRQKLPLWSTLDSLTPLFAMLMIGLSLSHLAAGTAFGSPTTLPWGIHLWNATRHPSQIYELITSLLVFGLIWFRKVDSPAGSDFLLFVALTAGAHLFSKHSVVTAHRSLAKYGGLKSLRGSCSHLRFSQAR